MADFALVETGNSTEPRRLQLHPGALSAPAICLHWPRLPLAPQFLPHRVRTRWMYKLRYPCSARHGVEAATCHIGIAWSVHRAPHRHALVGSLPRWLTPSCTFSSLTVTCIRNSTTLSLKHESHVSAEDPGQNQFESTKLSGFFNSNEQRFANSSTLPASFYSDIQRIICHFATAKSCPTAYQHTDQAHNASDAQSQEQPARAGISARQHPQDITQKSLPRDEVTLARNSGFWSLQEHDTNLDDSLFPESQSMTYLEKAWDTTGNSKLRKRHYLRSFRPSLIVPPTNVQGFQAWSDARSLTSYFVQHLYRPWATGQALPHTVALAFLHRHQLAKERGHSHGIDDIISWSWILAAPGSLSAKRFVALSERNRRNGLPPLPLWITLQLLRATYIDNLSLKLLLAECLKNLPQWSHNRDAQSILIVRMLRHSRKSAAVCLEDIVDFATQIMSTWPNTTRQNKATTAWCNRLLSLLALPSSPRAFDSMRTHQAAQVAILRFMHAKDPEIPVTREGYRALLRTQLMHPKTPEEQDWARAKSTAWPPWQPINPTGLEVKVEFPGKTTRLMKVLHRMNDNGYSSREFDVASQVLSGWDTDRSPTIQVRRSASFLPLSEPWRPGKIANDLSTLHHVWLARVESTRSVREAWMCFCSYVDLVPKPDRSALVYHAMMRKLLAQIYRPGGKHSILPGDDLTVYPDPVDSRDLVWISEPVPGVKEFVRRMSDEGHQLGPDVLADLLNSTTSFMDASLYLASSTLDPETRDALVQQNVYVDRDTVSKIRRLPKRLFASYIGLLVRAHSTLDAVETIEAARRETFSDNKSPNTFRSSLLLLRAWNILRICHPEEPTVWEAFLKALVSNMYKPPGQKTIGLSRTWELTLECLGEMRNKKFSQVPRTFKTFGSVAAVALQVSLQGLPMLRESSTKAPSQEPWAVAVSVFAEAAVGDRRQYSRWSELMNDNEPIVLASPPTGDDIENMAWITWLTNREHQVERVLELLHWLHRHQTQFFSTGGSMSKQNMSALRIMLEGHWADDEEWNKGSVRVADDKQLTTFEEMCEAFGYPDDDEVIAYLAARKRFIRRVREKMQHKIN